MPETLSISFPFKIKKIFVNFKAAQNAAEYFQLRSLSLAYMFIISLNHFNIVIYIESFSLLLQLTPPHPLLSE